MDSSASAENSKKQKLLVQQCTDEIDIISNLPQHILHYILSFLPTKYAVGTSVLSTRWNGLWTSIHNLDFCDKHRFSTSSKTMNYKTRKRVFTDFVYRVLRNDVSSLQKFSLKCMECDASDFNEWISTVVRRKVQELSITIYKGFTFQFLDCLFTCESLRILKIDMSVSMKMPASVCFSSLKVLHLRHIAFFGDQSIQEISLSCPILDELFVDYCVWWKIKNVTISAPMLQKLKIEDGTDASNDCEIRIYAESLVSLKFKGYLSHQKYSLCNLSSLVDASIELLNSRYERVHHVGSLLRQIANVKSLELSFYSVEVLSHPDLSIDVLALSRLIHLTLGYGTEANGRAFINLLCSMPNIESVFLPYGLRLIRFKGQGRIMGTTTKCFLSQLKLIDIRHFSWVAEKQWFVKFLIKSARVVDKLTIKLTTNSCFDSRYPGELPERDIKELQMLARNTNCVLQFS